MYKLMPNCLMDHLTTTFIPKGTIFSDAFGLQSKQWAISMFATFSDDCDFCVN